MGDYALLLKGNQPKLSDDASWLLDCHLRDGVADWPVCCCVETEEGNERLESRRNCQPTVPAYLRGRLQSKGLETIGAALRRLCKNGVEKMDSGTARCER